MTRFEFSKTQKTEIFKRSDGICEAGKEGTEAFYGMEPGETCNLPAKEFDHVIADALKREKPRSADDGLHVCLKHHKNKTHGHDRPMIKKAKDIREKNAGVVAPKAKIQSAPFFKAAKPKGNDAHIAAMAAKNKRIVPRRTA